MDYPSFSISTNLDVARYRSNNDAADGGEKPRHYLNEASGVVGLAAPGPSGEDGIVVPYHGSVRAAARRGGVAPAACELAGSAGSGFDSPRARGEVANLIARLRQE